MHFKSMAHKIYKKSISRAFMRTPTLDDGVWVIFDGIPKILYRIDDALIDDLEWRPKAGVHDGFN